MTQCPMTKIFFGIWGLEFIWSGKKEAPNLKDIIEASKKEFGESAFENLKINVEYGPHNVPTFLQILKIK